MDLDIAWRHMYGCMYGWMDGWAWTLHGCIGWGFAGISAFVSKVLGRVAKWRHRSLLLKLCFATVILLTLPDGRMREVGEQGGFGFQLSLAWRGPRAPKVCLCAIAHTIEC